MENSFTYVIAFWGVLGWFVFRLVSWFVFRLVSGFVLLVAVKRIIRNWWAHVGFLISIRGLMVTSSGNNSDQSSKNENLLYATQD